MTDRMPSARAGFFFCLLAVLPLVLLSGCGDREPEQRAAFIAYLTNTVLPQKGSALPALSREEEKTLGEYADHYAVLTGFQNAMAAATAENARDLLALADMENLAAVAREESSLRSAAREARKLQQLVRGLREKADKARAKLDQPEDLAPVYAAVYEKTVVIPSQAASAAFGAVHTAFSATLDLLDFISTHSHDLKIEDGKINVYNQAVEPELKDKMAAVRATSDDLRKAYAAMMKAMLQ